MKKEVILIDVMSGAVFDTIILLGNRFGLVGNPKRIRWLLKRFKKITTERGRISRNYDPYD